MGGGRRNRSRARSAKGAVVKCRTALPLVGLALAVEACATEVLRLCVGAAQSLERVSVELDALSREVFRLENSADEFTAREVARVDALVARAEVYEGLMTRECAQMDRAHAKLVGLRGCQRVETGGARIRLRRAICARARRRVRSSVARLRPRPPGAGNTEPPPPERPTRGQRARRGVS